MNMIRWGLPSLHSPFTTTTTSTNSSPLCCSLSAGGKELDYGTAKLSAIGFGESELPHKDSSRLNACSSSAPQNIDNDYSNLEMIFSKRSHKGLYNMINGTQGPPEKDTSLFVRSIQACSGSHFHLLMENINVLENKIADTNMLKLEKDILMQLERLGALELFHACLSRTISDPTELTGDSLVKEMMGNDSSKIRVCSKRKEERKTRQERRMQASSKKAASVSERSIEESVQPSVPFAAKKGKAMGRRVMLAKNEAEMSKGIKVVANLERVKAAVEKETGRSVSLGSWAEAAGIDEKLLLHRLHFGWYCRDKLLKSGHSLVVYLARNYRGLGVPYEDLIQAGNVGVLQGAERFDHTRGYQFSTYVQYWIRKAMFQLVSRHGRGIKVPFTLSTAINRVQKARKVLKRTHGKHPDDVELAKFTGLSLGKIQAADKCLRVVGSIDQKIGDGIDVKFLECTPDISIEVPEKTVMKEHMKKDINKLLKQLDPKEREVLVLRYGFQGHRMSLNEVGKIFNVSKEWIRKMENRALAKLKDGENQTSLRHYVNL